APVQRYVPEFRGDGKEAVTIRHLLTHSSGLPAWRPLYQEADSRATAPWVVNTTPLATPPGRAYVYSDLGAMVLTEVVERITGEPLDRFLERRVFRPLGMPATRYLPPERWRERIAPTENDTSFRHRMLRGEVHDENAGRLGGVSGHAGLSPRAFGHTGFTGTSLWMDPQKDLFIILLTNRVHPTRANTAILRVRPRVADLVVGALTHPEL